MPWCLERKGKHNILKQKHRMKGSVKKPYKSKVNLQVRDIIFPLKIENTRKKLAVKDAKIQLK